MIHALQEFFESWGYMDEGPDGDRVACNTCGQRALRKVSNLACGCVQTVLRCQHGCRPVVTHAWAKDPGTPTQDENVWRSLENFGAREAAKDAEADRDALADSLEQDEAWAEVRDLLRALLGAGWSYLTLSRRTGENIQTLRRASNGQRPATALLIRYQVALRPLVGQEPPLRGDYRTQTAMPANCRGLYFGLPKQVAWKVGRAAEVGRRLGVSGADVSKWFSAGRLPEEILPALVAALETLTKETFAK